MAGARNVVLKCKRQLSPCESGRAVATLLQCAKSNHTGIGREVRRLPAPGKVARGALRRWEPGAQVLTLPIWSRGTSAPGLPPLCASPGRRHSPPGAHGAKHAAKSVRTCPRAPEPTSPGWPAVPHELRVLGGLAEKVRGHRGYPYRLPELVARAWSRRGIAKVLAQLIWRRGWVQLGRRGLGLSAQGPGDGRVGLRGPQGSAERKDKATHETGLERGSRLSSGYSTLSPHRARLRRAGERCLIGLASLGRSKGGRGRRLGQPRGGEAAHPPFSARVELSLESVTGR